MKRKPIKVNTRCVADAYSAPNEKIVEFSAVHAGELIGGLISFRLTDEGKLEVCLYCLDPGVNVVSVGFKPNDERAITITNPLRN